MCKAPEQVETQSQYLPDVPSQAQVAKEDISPGEMNAVLLQKIEELTLYVIEIKKENIKQNELITKLQNTYKTYKDEY